MPVKKDVFSAEGAALMPTNDDVDDQVWHRDELGHVVTVITSLTQG